MSKTTKPQAVATFDERIAFQAATLLEKETGFGRGWRAADEPEVKAAIAQYNEREYARAKAALLASLG